MLTNAALESRFLELVHPERRINVEILGLLLLAQERKLRLEQGYPSLFDWLVRKFGYSEGSAYRRIQAARLVAEVPGAASKIVEGRLTVSALAKAQAAIKLQERSGHPVNKAAVVDLVTDCNLLKNRRKSRSAFSAGVRAQAGTCPTGKRNSSSPTCVILSCYAK